jgi:hypothetical protein
LRNQEEISRYFLGELSDVETQRFERDCFDDDAFAESVLVVEDELIDRYVRNELSPEQHDRFEHSYLITDARRTRVTMARMLNHQPNSKTQVSRDDRIAVPGFWQRLAVGGPRRAYVMVAAILTVIVLGVWLLIRTSKQEAITRVNPPLNVASPESTGTPNGPSVGQSPHGSPSPNASTPTQQAAIAVFTLRPGATRDFETTEQIIRLSFQNEDVELHFVLGSAFQQPYEVRIETVEGQTVLRRRGIESVEVNGERTLVVRAQASTFGARDYIGRVIDREGNAGASYSFRVVKRPK